MSQPPEPAGLHRRDGDVVGPPCQRAGPAGRRRRPRLKEVPSTPGHCPAGFLAQSVCRSGSTTHVRCGSVTALNATVNYPQGTVHGLIRTNVCAEPGDSGGPLSAGTVALRLTSGGSGTCPSAAQTFLQPVTEPLRVYGVTVY